jgi:hypothetical protein
MRMTITEEIRVRNWLKNSQMDDESIETFIDEMQEASCEFGEECAVFYHPELGVWVVTRYGAIFSGPKDTDSMLEYKGELTLFGIMEVTYDPRTGKIKQIRK